MRVPEKGNVLVNGGPGRVKLDGRSHVATPAATTAALDGAVAALPTTNGVQI